MMEAAGALGNTDGQPRNAVAKPLVRALVNDVEVKLETDANVCDPASGE